MRGVEEKNVDASIFILRLQNAPLKKYGLDYFIGI
jgi:hypothetical protein